MMNLNVTAKADYEATFPVYGEEAAYARVNEVKTGAVNNQHLFSMLQRLIASLDCVISAQVSEIIHHPQFEALEASWRGLVYLLDQCHKQKQVKIRIFNITKTELRDDVSRALEYDQSQLFQKVYNEEFGMPGGEPFGVLVGDYEFSHHPEDVEILQGISQVSAAAFVPFIAGASPVMFGLNKISELELQPDLEIIFKQPTYARWNFLRQTEDSRFLGLVAPHFLLRLPYVIGHGAVYPFFFKDTKQSSAYLWGNGSFAFAAVLIKAFVSHGWLANIRGCAENSKGGGNVPAAAYPYFTTDKAGLARKIVTDVLITDGLEKDLDSLGFIALCQPYNGYNAVFYGNSSVQKPKEYNNLAASQNAAASVMLQHIFCASRFAHYLKLMGRDKVGSYASALSCQHDLNRWLANYIASNTDLSSEMRSRYPLQEAKVQVKDAPGKPGHYMCVIHLRPRFQLEQVATSITLVTELTSIVK
jgi:type VI secretion system protein ImpD